jgi:hypothetical protein
MSFERARRIADAVLYEGYILYPYRPSATKNRFRWQFGVVAPRAWSEAGGEAWEMQTECLVEPADAALVDVAVRFLQVRAKESVSAQWDEGIERTIDCMRMSVEELASAAREVPFEIAGEVPLTGLVHLAAERMGAFFKLRVRIENHTAFPDAATADRSAAMRRALVGCHTLLAVTGGGFVSLIDPPAAARDAARQCANLHTWPVLVGEGGERDTVLSSPIILDDYPAIAPESQGDFYDSAEIDELLTLRVMTLTDEEKREAAASDERARRIIERCDSMVPEDFERLHGAARALTSQGVRRGDRVRLAPKRRADAMDLFLAGRNAVVERIERDFEDRVYVAVTVEDDPAAEIQGSVGRFFYFYPDELELIGKEA